MRAASYLRRAVNIQPMPRECLEWGGTYTAPILESLFGRRDRRAVIPDFRIGAELWAANEFLSLCWGRILLESLKLQFDSCGGHGKTLGLIRGNIWPLAQFRGPKFHEFRAKKTRKNRSLKST